MIMLSGLRRFTLVDAKGRSAPLLDVAVALLDGDYPPVTRLLFQAPDKQPKFLPWSAVESMDMGARQIKVTDFDEVDAVTTGSLRKELLLGRDVLDALVIDLQNRRVTRANDLWLEDVDGRLMLRAADTSARAILRRISRGLYGQVRESALYDWKYIEFLRGDPCAVSNGAGYNLRITRLPPGEIARLTDPLPYLHAAELLTLLPDPKAVSTLEAMAAERQLQVFEELEEDQALRLLALMSPDAAADLVGRLHPSTARRYLETIPKKQSERIIELLRYPEDTVGGIMTNNVVSIGANLTVKEAREALRERLKEPGFVFLVYVVDGEEERHLRGLISLRNLLTADDDKKLEDVMDPYVTTLNPLDAADKAAYQVINSDLAAMPVVGNKGQLIGVVTVDAAVGQVAPSSWRTQAPRVFT